MEQLVQETVVQVPRSLIAETVDLIVVLSGRGSNRQLTELVWVEGLAADGAYHLRHAIPSLES